MNDIPIVTQEEEPKFFGWIVAIPEGGIGDQHMIPGCDIRDHITDENCWCNPQLVDHEMVGLIHQHKALDNREAYFSGAKKLN